MSKCLKTVKKGHTIIHENAPAKDRLFAPYFCNLNWNKSSSCTKCAEILCTNSVQILNTVINDATENCFLAQLILHISEPCDKY